MIRVIHRHIVGRCGLVIQTMGANFYLIQWDNDGSELVPISDVYPDPNYL